MQETQEMLVRSLGQEDPLEEEIATTPVFLQENPMGRGAWWATVYMVTKSQTRLKQLSIHLNNSLRRGEVIKLY